MHERPDRISASATFLVLWLGQLIQSTAHRRSGPELTTRSEKGSPSVCQV
jgi:hypothetical protein